MQVWLAIQLFGAFICALAGIMIGLTASTIFHQMLGTVTFGFASLTIAVIGAGQVLQAQLKAQEALLRDMRDGLQDLVTRTKVQPAAALPLAAPHATTQSEGQRTCPSCGHVASPRARECTACGTNFHFTNAPKTDPATPRRHTPFGMRYCPACQELNWHNVKVCKHCGVDLPSQTVG